MLVEWVAGLLSLAGLAQVGSEGGGRRRAVLVRQPPPEEGMRQRGGVCGRVGGCERL